jgi:hypothetical protein
MSSDFSTVLVKDDRIGAITSSVRYGVYKSGSNVTTAVYNAISGADALNPSTVVFSLQVPSESVVVDRRVKFGATVEFQVSCTTANIPGGAAAINWASSDGLGAFPLHSLFSSMNVTINNNSVSVQQQEIQAAILQMQDSEYYKRWGGGAPNKKDVLQQYSQSKGTVISSIGGFDNVADTDSQARGSWNVNSVTTAVVGANTVFTISIDLVEYLMVSPFIWDDTHNPAGLLGIQTLNFQFQLGTLARFFRTANQASNNAALVKTCTGVTLRNPRLIFQFLSLHADEQIPSRNVVPYMEYPLYKTRSSVQVAQLPAPDQNTGAVVAPPYEIVSNTFSLNQIPDKLLIYVRKPFSAMTNGDADAFLPINNISISFNNSQGILSGADQYTLWQMSVESGSNQSWQEFRGFATVPNIGSNVPSRVSTIGSCLVLDMGKCVQISDSFLAPGSVGQFSLQVTVRGYNNFPEAITPELTVICVNSGLFVCDRGQSTSFSGLLQKSLVLDASAKPAYTEGDVERLVGGKKRMVASMMGMEPMGSAAPGSSSVTGGAVNPGSSSTGGRLQTRFK